MIKKIEFIKGIELIISTSLREDIFIKSINNAVGCEFINETPIGFIIDDMVNYLSSLVGDRYRLISWWLYENNQGKEDMQISINGRYHKISNSSQLYSAIVKINKPPVFI